MIPRYSLERPPHHPGGKRHPSSYGLQITRPVVPGQAHPASQFGKLRDRRKVPHFFRGNWNQVNILSGPEFLLGGEINLGKMNIQLDAKVENQDRSECGQNQARRMVSFV